MIASHAAHTDVRGIIQTWEKGGLIDTSGPIPVVGTFPPVGGAADYRTALLAHVDGWSTGVPHSSRARSTPGRGHPPTSSPWWVSLPEKFEVVLADEVFRLVRRRRDIIAA